MTRRGLLLPECLPRSGSLQREPAHWRGIQHHSQPKLFSSSFAALSCASCAAIFISNICAIVLL